MQKRLERVVKTRNMGAYRLFMMQVGRWELYIAERSVVFTQFGKHWTPFYGEYELSSCAASKLNTAVCRVVLRARCAQAFANGLAALGAA